MIIPHAVYAQNTTIENQTITIKAEVSESPETRELLKQLVESQQNQSEKFNRLMDDFNKKQSDIQNNYDGWSTGDILISSATIFAFFSFGSFLVIRFETKKRNELSYYVDSILTSVFGIQILQLVIMAFVVLNADGIVLLFIVDLVGVAIFLLGIKKYVKAIIELENKEAERANISRDFIDNIFDSLSTQGLEVQVLRSRISDLERENRRLRHEMGD